MAVQLQSTSNALTVKAWNEKLTREIPKEMFFDSFMSEKGDNVVYVKNTSGKKGDVETFGLTVRLNTPALHYGDSIEGNEATITTYSMDVGLDEQKFAVRTGTDLDQKRPVWMMKEEIRKSLIVNAAEKRDQLIFDRLYAGTLSKILYGGSATSIATLTTSDKLTPELISRAKAGAKTGYNRTQPPLVPIRIKGKDHYVFLAHVDSFYDLMQDSRFDQARREAMERSSDHPLFAGADVCMWDGVIVKCHENVPISLTGGAGGNVPYAKNVLLGAQALCFHLGKKETIVEEQFDYKTQTGYASIAMYEAERATFNSKDFGVVGVFTARTSIADA